MRIRPANLVALSSLPGERPRLRWDGRVPLVLGVLLAVVTGGLIYLSLRQAREEAPPPQEVVSVLVATTDLPAGATLDANAAKTLFSPSRVPASSAPDDTVGSLASVDGRSLSVALHAGDVLRSSQLVTTAPSTVSGPRADLLPTGHVAIVLDVNEHISVGGAVMPRDRVDLIATIPVAQPGGGPAVPVTQALLRDVQVLATGFQTRPVPLSSSGQSSEATTPAPYSTLTLALTPQDAVLVQHLLAQNVRLALALRRPGEALDATAPQTTAEIAQRYNLAAAARVVPPQAQAPTPPQAQAQSSRSGR